MDTISTNQISKSTSNFPFQKVETTCPLCDSSDYKVMYFPWVIENDPKKLYGAASGIQGTQQIVKCKSCEMIYENPRFPESVILSGYENTNESGHDSQYPMRVESFYRALVKNSKYLPGKGAKILDIGTAGGGFLEAAKKFGYASYGLEPSRYLVEQGNRRGLNLSQGTIQKNDYSAQSFDLICLWDVLEHLSDPKQDLLAIRKLLKPDGKLLINYPNIDSLPARILKAKYWWILSVHLLQFSRDTIRKICSRTGFRVVTQKMYWQTLEFGYLQQVAAHLGVPGAAMIKRLTPMIIQRIKIPYYACQTTAIAELKHEV